MDTTLSINLISANPTVRNGSPCIAQTGIRVIDIVFAALFRNETPDEIAAGYEVSIASVHAALAYYYENKSEMDETIRTQLEKSRNFKQEWIDSGGTQLLP